MHQRTISSADLIDWIVQHPTHYEFLTHQLRRDFSPHAHARGGAGRLPPAVHGIQQHAAGGEPAVLHRGAVVVVGVGAVHSQRRAERVHARQEAGAHRQLAAGGGGRQPAALGPVGEGVRDYQRAAVEHAVRVVRRRAGGVAARGAVAEQDAGAGAAPAVPARVPVPEGRARRARSSTASCARRC